MLAFANGKTATNTTQKPAETQTPAETQKPTETHQPAAEAYHGTQW